MKLPRLLLLLIAVGGTLSKLTTEKSPVSGQTTKRELLEGNFGVRTAFLNKYEPPNITPGIQYTENLKQDLHQQSAVEQIFGSRIFPITKISDLLTGQGPPFDIALANHLYSPVSVYNTKKLASLDETSTMTTNFDFHHSKPENLKPKSGPYYVEEIRPKKILSRKPNFHLPGILGSEFHTQESKYRELRPKPLTSTPAPQLYVYKEQFNFGPFIPIAYNQQHPPVKAKPEELGFDYGNQEGSREDKTQGLEKVATAYRPEKPSNPYIEAKGYHAHPDGAISYSRFIHDQAILDAQPDSQILYHVPTKTGQQTFTPDFNEKFKFKENMNVPKLPSSTNAKDGSVPQQYVPVLQSQHQFHLTPTQQAPFQSGFHLEKLSDPKFAIQQGPRRPIYYLHPIKKPYNHLQPSFALPSLENQQPPLKALPNIVATLEPLHQVTNNSATRDAPGTPLTQLLIPTQSGFTPQPNPQNSAHLLRHYTTSPATVTHYQSVVPLNTAPATIQPQVQNTPKYPLSIDQVLQPTTTQPETLSVAPKDIKAEPKHLSQESISFNSPTLQPFLVSPVTLQPISYATPENYPSSTPGTEILTRAQQTHAQASPHHQVQIQQQNFQEIHSELAPERQDNSQHLENLRVSQEKHQSFPTTPEYQSTTPQSTETSSPDYEIEIASHIDHNQLPKDIRPITTTHAANDLVENHDQQGQQPYSLNNTFILERGPYVVPIQSFGEPPSYQNINYHDPNSLFLGQSLATIQPFVQPRDFSNVQELVLQPHFQQTSSFPPVQYFGKYAQSIFGNI